MVDTPEIHHKKDGEQPFAQEAKDYTIKLLENAEKIEAKLFMMLDRKQIITMVY